MTNHMLDEAINNLASGSAICFLGAGFAANALDSLGKSVPSAEDLEREICELIGIPREEGGALSDLADYCQNNRDLESKLNALLIQRLTLCKPSADQEKILRAPWRSIFTTNFDDIIERALSNNATQVITPTADGRSLTGDKVPIFYLHGRALDILESRAAPNIILSESNYLDLKNENKNLYAIFINEIICASRVFFIGYSLRDMEIAKRLFTISEGIKSKSVVICGPSEGVVAKARLEKFGDVYAIGLNGFANHLPDNYETRLRNVNLDNLAFVKKVTVKPAASEILRKDVDHIILTGEFEYSKFATQLASNDSQSLYCISRFQRIKEVFDDRPNTTSRFMVSSDIGNGKTVFLDQLGYAALSRGYDVYRIDSRLAEVFGELTKLLKRQTRQMFVIDDLVRNRAAAEFIGARLSGMSMLVCATRDTLDDTRHADLSVRLGGALREIDLNILSNSELSQWNQLLERWGYWEQRISLSEDQRFQFLKKECGSENRSIVISIFKTSRIAEKIHGIVKYFLESKPQHTRAFVAILISSLCQKHVEWGKVVQWLKIDEHSLRVDLQNEPLFDFMSSRRDWYQFTSTQLADYIFKTNNFDEGLIVDIYTKIVRETAYSSNDSRTGLDSYENLKELMKYRFLVRLFGEKSSAFSSIEAVYRRLSDVPKIRRNDQFWLQYAMSNMEIGNLDDAETYINNALGIAKTRGADYSPHQILDQQIRLLFLKNTTIRDSPNKDEINTALTNLENEMAKREGDIVYPIRSAKFILDFLDEKIDFIDLPTRRRLLKLLNAMSEEMKAGQLRKSQKGETEILRKKVNLAILVLQNA